MYWRQCIFGDEEHDRMTMVRETGGACKPFLWSHGGYGYWQKKKKVIFLVSVGGKTYKLIESLVAPEDPKDKSFKDLAQLTQDHFMPSLRPLCNDSSFTLSVFNQVRQLNLGQHLIKCYVIGVHDIWKHRLLLVERKLTFKQALYLAVAIKVADKDSSEMHKGDSQE